MQEYSEDSIYKSANHKHGLVRDVILDDVSAFWSFTHLLNMNRAYDRRRSFPQHCFQTSARYIRGKAIRVTSQ